MSFPIFPVFRKLTPEDRSEYLEYYRAGAPYCDFSFNNVIVWLNQNDDLEVARYKGCLILRFSNPFEEDSMAYTLLGKHNCMEAAEQIFDLQKSHHQTPRLVMVPEEAIDDMRTSPRPSQSITLSSSIDHRDYIFDIPTVLGLAGKRYADLRHSLNSFNRTYGDQVSVRHFKVGDPHLKRLLEHALARWSGQERFTKNDPRLEEAKALQRYQRYNKYCPAECLGFFIGDQMFGVSIFHLPPQPGWAIGNHIKCDPTVRYAFDFICYTTMCFLNQKGIGKINGEQDLGILGLRAHKQQLGPTGFLCRYDVTPTLVGVSSQ